MFTNKKFDYLIVGLGIAGSCLALKALNRNKSVLIYDENTTITSSKIAAGIINPITGKQLNRSWNLEACLKEAKKFYQTCEVNLNHKFYHELDILRLFKDAQEKSKFLTRANDQNFSDFLNPANNISSKLNAPLGGFIIKKGGYVKLKNLVAVTKNYLIDLNSYKEEKFEIDVVEVKQDYIKYKDYYAKKVIFCDGAQASTNIFFPELKFRNAKGEIALVKIPDLEQNYIYKKEVFLLPLGDNIFKLGATYSWDNLDNQVTTKGLEFLEDNLKNLINLPYQIIATKAAVRPILEGKIPAVGCSKKSNLVAIVNGLGSKGALYAPFVCESLLDHLESEIELPTDINIHNRFNL